MSYLNLSNEKLLRLAHENVERYQNASPFPSICFSDLVKDEVLDVVLDEFPDLSKRSSTHFNNTKEIKYMGRGEEFFGKQTIELMHYLNSEPFLNFLQVLTGIKEKLISDPYYVGGGQHEIKRGGLLKVHSDFNKHQTLGLDRRINVLIYLNKDWKEEYGGHFELWNRDMTECTSKVLPLFNSMAIFSTTDFSYHGHPNPLTCPEDRSRRSLALYYYSNGRPDSEINNGMEEHDTLFKARKNNMDDEKAFS